MTSVSDEVQPNATMETRVAGQGQPKRVGRWTLAQLRQTDGIIPSQAGWNKGDSQKHMTNFGTPRNTQLRVKSENLQELPEDVMLRTHGEVRLQSGTNKFDSQRGMTGFGTGRDVCREGVHVNTAPNLSQLPEEKIRLSDGIVRLQAGTNKYDSQKGMTGFGTSRRETTKMLDSKHPEYDHERPDQSEIPLQAGTNKFASQKGMTGFGTSRRETTRILDSAHPEYNPESSIDSTTIPSQMGSNKYASQKGMTGFGQPRWEVLDPSISWQNRKSQGLVRLQSGTNRFASQQGMTGFGTPRNTTYEAEAGELPYEDMKKSETIIPSQAGWNKGESQKGMTGFGAPRDVKGKHLKRIWELEYPEEAEVSLDRL
uniref:Calponin-like protein OV9M n=1 Tax=Syphacia muris TaxID=451379 RepID=A0A0N5AJ96_9BILA